MSDDYLAFLESRGVSYVFGGGKINGSCLAAGVIDELSILIAPVADGSIGTPTLFDAMAGKGWRGNSG